MSTNQLYPIFLKLDQFTTLIVGGGDVAHEKLSFLLKSSPNARVLVVSVEIDIRILALAAGHEHVELLEQPYHVSLLEEKQLVIVATDNSSLNSSIWRNAKDRNIMVNVADTPALCDFYLGGIVTKGDLKVAISTNGKSPTFAKRFRELLEEVLPDELPELLDNLKVLRDRFEGSFAEKVKSMNKLTAELIKN